MTAAYSPFISLLLQINVCILRGTAEPPRKMFPNKTEGAFQHSLVENVINIALEYDPPSNQGHLKVQKSWSNTSQTSETAHSWTIAPKSTKQKSADWRAVLEAVEAPQKNLMRNPFGSDAAVWCHIYWSHQREHNPFLEACCNCNIGKVQHVLYLQITVSIRSSGVTTHRHKLLSLKKYCVLLKAGQH